MLKLSKNKKTAVKVMLMAGVGILIYFGFGGESKPKSGPDIVSSNTDKSVENTVSENNSQEKEPRETVGGSGEVKKTKVNFSDLNPSSSTVKVNQTMSVVTYVDHPEAKIILRATTGDITKTFASTNVSEGGGVTWEFKLDKVGEWSLQAFTEGNYEGSSKSITITVQT